jgi:hypothetical protein
MSSHVIQTYGQVLPHLHVEPILNPRRPGTLRLHTWNGRTAVTRLTLEHEGCTYIPGPIDSGLLQVVRFPKRSAGFGSPTKLTSSMLDFLSRYANLSVDTAGLLVASALASWFTDCAQVAPVLYLLGPENETGLILRLLGCLCRRPILLGDVDLPALGTLPCQLGATLLIDQRNLSRRVRGALRASSRRHFFIARGRGQLHIYGAKVFSADPCSVDGQGLQVCVAPAQDPLPELTDEDDAEIGDDFQAKLLRFRMVSYRRVRDAKPDCRDFIPAMRGQIRTLLAPLGDCEELRDGVLQYLLRQSQEAAGARFTDLECVVSEAALFFCHTREDTREFFVGQLAEKVRALLKGRHEDFNLTDKKVGSALRGLGIRGARVTAGYKVLLTDSVREQIHRVAHAYQALPVQDGIARCRHCPGVET